jgi:DNA/RNA-binding domain of Phe-tRNA-synthetase-like protein
MPFSHSADLWRDFPALVPGILFTDRISPHASVEDAIARFSAAAASRVAAISESELPEIQAWRRVFSRMGLKPTQYRCASEALLRRFRKEGTLPRIHPLIDLCNAASLAFAIPIAVFDTAKLAGDLVVRYADGTETYLAFSGDEERPETGEVIFADAGGQAHARRWTNRQSATSAIRSETTSALIVAEAVHETAAADMPRLVGVLAAEIKAIWLSEPRTAILTATSPGFVF